MIKGNRTKGLAVPYSTESLFYRRSGVSIREKASTFSIVTGHEEMAETKGNLEERTAKRGIRTEPRWGDILLLAVGLVIIYLRAVTFSWIGKGTGKPDQHLKNATSEKGGEDLLVFVSLSTRQRGDRQNVGGEG